MELFGFRKIEKVSEVLDFLGDETELGRRLKQISTAEERLGEMIKRYSDFTDVEAYLQSAKAKMEEANTRIAEVDALVNAKTQEAEKIDAEVKVQRESLANDMKSEKNFIAERHRELNERETSLIEREKAVNEAGKAAETQMAKAEQLKAQADSVIGIYNAKMSKLKELAA